MEMQRKITCSYGQPKKDIIELWKAFDSLCPILESSLLNKRTIIWRLYENT